MNKRWNKLCVSALACMALVVPLTACEGQLPTPAADTSTKVAPDLTEAQEKKIRLKILKTIDEADQAKNPDGYATVMGGPQLDIRISQTTINQRNGPSAAFHGSPHIGILERHRVIGTGRRSLTRAASLLGAQLAP